jgi:hypothetical protein
VDKLVWLMNNEDENITTKFATYIFKCSQHRNTVVKN